MKVTITIEIYDSTSEEEMKKAGMTSSKLEGIYRNAYDIITQNALQPGCSASVKCVVTDNTEGE